MAVRAPLHWRLLSHEKNYQLTQKHGILRHSECWYVIKVESCIIWIPSSNNYYNSVCKGNPKLSSSCFLVSTSLCLLPSFKIALVTEFFEVLTKPTTAPRNPCFNTSPPRHTTWPGHWRQINIYLFDVNLPGVFEGVQHELGPPDAHLL